MAPKMEIHVENWNHGLHVDNQGHQSDVVWLVSRAWDAGVTPDIYVLKDWADENHRPWSSEWKTHGVHHYYDEKADRSPYYNQEGMPFPPSGGFFFRVMPLWYLKWAIKKSGVFWIHPHDLDENHPRLKNPLLDFKRRIGLKTARKKFIKLLEEVDFD